MLLFYPGSFDPLHRGHVDLVTRTRGLCTTLVVGIGHNPAKQPLLGLSERMSTAREEFAGLPHVRVESYEGATLVEARRLGAQALLRGVRTISDLEFEMTMAAIHRSQGLETVFLLSAGALAHISSSAVRMALHAGIELNDLVPPAVKRTLERRIAP